ncbi:MAG: 3-hydroxyacyl-CoA dehydrogenase family protein [Promethearchaeota archaeon]
MVDISNVRNVTVIGAGVQGHKIAQVALMAGFDKVFLNSRTIQSIEKAVNQIINSKSHGLKVLESKGFLKEGQTTESLISRLVKEPDLKNAVKETDFVIEAVPEILELKQNIFRKMGEFSPEHTIFATDTSTMSITKIGQSSGRPDKVMGMHFFSPIGSKLIEITRGKDSSDNTMDIGYQIANRFPCERGERMVIRLEKESPGFVVNRVIGTGEIYFKWVIEQATMRGIPYEHVDADVIKLMPMGCCLMCDIMGLDTVYNSMKYFASTLSSDFTPSPVFKKLIDQGYTGKKSGRGFYDWSKGKPIINRKKKAGLMDVKIVAAIHLNEGCKLLEAGIVDNYEIIDDAVSAGYHIPGPFKVGKRWYKRLSKLLGKFAEKTNTEYLKPCHLMKSGEFRKMSRQS